MTKVALGQPHVFGRPEHINSAKVVERNRNHLGEQDVEILVASRVDRCTAVPGNRRREGLGNMPD